MNFTKYEVTSTDIPFYSKSEIYKKHLKKAEENFVGTVEQLEKIRNKANKEAEEEYKTQISEYANLCKEKEQQFMEDLFKEFGVKDNPKAVKAYQYAYQQGHASGYNEVYYIFSDIVELIK